MNKLIMPDVASHALPDGLALVRAPVVEDLLAVDALMHKELASGVDFVGEVLTHIMGAGGKRLRPLLVLLVAGACGYREGVLHHDLAATIELIHTATLLHDDVVDKSEQRRGHKTANVVWGNHVSVLVGDFLYSRAFQVLARSNHIPVMHLLAHTISEISEGELWQLTNQYNPDMDETIYYEVIRRKTAELFSAAGEAAAIFAQASPVIQKAMAAFGLQLGLAYQMIDDLLDYSRDTVMMDKNLGDDLSEGKITLPVIYARQQVSDQERAHIDDMIRTGDNQGFDDLLVWINQTGAREAVLQAAKQRIDLAKAELHCFASESVFRIALEGLLDWVIVRDY